jgi:hypothetical protein
MMRRAISARPYKKEAELEEEVEAAEEMEEAEEKAAVGRFPRGCPSRSSAPR